MTNTPSSRKKILLRVLSELTGLEEDEITPNLPLLDGGYLTSLQVVELVTRLEEETGVRFLDMDVTPDNFQDPGRIEALLEERSKGSPP